MARATKPNIGDRLWTKMHTVKRVVPGASTIEAATLAATLLQVESFDAMRDEMRSAGQTASKVLEVLLKQYSRLALATHDAGVGNGDD